MVILAIFSFPNTYDDKYTFDLILYKIDLLTQNDVFIKQYLPFFAYNKNVPQIIISIKPVNTNEKH
ncbi:hypothetical protein DF947_18055 [Pedobacter paludis]|uniref:Uncharacterized protein n=1 Tax=Pedobacter paludis TaxID=2203212 RepID=A0A317EWJ5_9SPHI|nr:hypothetical protein DF947_18055 [Pedobacter paludis]